MLILKKKKKRKETGEGVKEMKEMKDLQVRRSVGGGGLLREGSQAMCRETKTKTKTKMMIIQYDEDHSDCLWN